MTPRQTIALADRGQHPIDLPRLDLDRFEEINDTFGHHTGHELLQTVACSLQRTLRASKPRSAGSTLTRACSGRRRSCPWPNAPA
jgi:diguanylate cyclase (GGDEF)-like protein